MYKSVFDCYLALGNTLTLCIVRLLREIVSLLLFQEWPAHKWSGKGLQREVPSKVEDYLMDNDMSIFNLLKIFRHDTQIPYFS